MIHAPANALSSVDLPGGVTLPYEERGGPGGLPVLLLHGLTDSLRSFEPVLPFLSASIRAIAPSQRGHGDAIKPEAGYAMADFAADAAALLDALGIESAVIVGHSMGSAVAARFAITYPERTSRLVLIGATGSWRNPTMVGLAEHFATLVDPIDPGFAREFQESTVAAWVPPAFMDAVVAESQKAPARVWQQVLAGLIDSDLTPGFGLIAAPTLIVRGELDELISAHEQAALTAAVAGSIGVTYPGVGHAPHWEEPERFAADLTDFLRPLVA